METAKVKIPKSLERALQRRNKRRLSRHSEPPEAPSNSDPSSPEDDEDRGNLPWRPVARSQLRSGLEEAAVLAFEEIDGVDVVYEEQHDGRRVAKLAVRTFAFARHCCVTVHILC